MFFCSNCGAKAEKGQCFCAFCGAPITQAKPKRPPRAVRPRSAFTVVASVLLCILLLFSLFPVFSTLTLQGALRQGTALNMLKRLDLDEIPMWQLDSEYEDDKSLSVADLFCEELNDSISDTIQSKDWESFTPESLNRFMQETTFPDFIARQIVRLLDAYLAGDTEFSVRSRDLERLLEQNLEYLNEELGISLEEEDISLAARQVIQGGSLDDIELPEPDRSTRKALQALDDMLDPSALLTQILVPLVLLVLLFLVDWRHPRFALRNTGIVCVLATVLPLVSTAVLRLMISRSAGSNAVLYIASVAGSCILESSLLPYVIAFAAGVILLIVSGVLKHRAGRNML